MPTEEGAPSSSSTPTTMPVPTNAFLTLTEEQIIEGFHTFLQSALAQARAEKLLDADTLASAEADIMVSGPALALYFGALRSTSDPPSVPLPRKRQDKSSPPLYLSRTTCPPAFMPLVQVWTSNVPEIHALPSQHKHDLARVICNLTPISHPIHPGINRIAADLRAAAIEISQRRTFQERYRDDLQTALDATQIGRTIGRGPSVTAHFVPPPMYEENDTASTGSRTPELKPESEYPKQSLDATRLKSPTLPQTDSALILIRETLFASLADVISITPSLRHALEVDPSRAYFSSVGLAILNVSLTALTPDGGVRGVLGRELTLSNCPDSLRPLMLELGAIAREAQMFAMEDDEDAMRLAALGRMIPESRLDRVRTLLEKGVGYDEREHSPCDGEDGRRSVEGRTVQFSNRVNKLALTMTNLPAFTSYAKDVFEVLKALG